MFVPVPTVTLSMFWPLLLFAAETYTESSPTVQRAVDRLLTDHKRLSAEIDADAIAEELAREHFPTGMVDGAGFDGNDPLAPWWADDDLHDTFLEAMTALEELTGGKLSPTDPAHVAMVARVIAISLGLAIYVEAPMVRTLFDVWEGEQDRQRGYWIRLEPSRPDPSGETRSALSVGQFFPYAAGQTAETVDYGKALFAWFLVRHAEIVAYFEAQDPDLSEVTTVPDQPAT